ncbi:hypothetical protein Nepgr_019533 [Nepenthes gracilis]|uniref:Uncharacterized protein n=1 Tax=Nepenthes gracilis TaxID=150966 RepID=A0AAD3SV73_NEPGR|nr:hypothetical protein Nepgr_019533 [Nepenthes gracilis]
MNKRSIFQGNLGPIESFQPMQPHAASTEVSFKAYEGSETPPLLEGIGAVVGQHVLFGHRDAPADKNKAVSAKDSVKKRFESQTSERTVEGVRGRGHTEGAEAAVGSVVGGDTGQGGALQALAGDVRHGGRGSQGLRRCGEAAPWLEGSYHFEIPPVLPSPLLPPEAKRRVVGSRKWRRAGQWEEMCGGKFRVSID